MEVGEVKTVIISADEAYGEHQDDLVIVFSKDELAEDLEIGDEVPLINAETQEVRNFTVIEITDTEVTLDGNHELADEDLIFEIEMVAIEPAEDITDIPQE